VPSSLTLNDHTAFAGTRAHPSWTRGWGWSTKNPITDGPCPYSRPTAQATCHFLVTRNPDVAGEATSATPRRGEQSYSGAGRASSRSVTPAHEAGKSGHTRRSPVPHGVRRDRPSKVAKCHHVRRRRSEPLGTWDSNGGMNRTQDGLAQVLFFCRGRAPFRGAVFGCWSRCFNRSTFQARNTCG
jgi:hypothetical protein